MVKDKQFIEANIKGILIYVIFFALVLILPAEALEERYPVGHPYQGLPHPDFVLSPYHEDPNHVLNRIFKASFLVTIAPAEVGLALPREHRDPAEFFRKPWYFAVRPGTPADQKLFGGDTRLLSRDGFTAGEATVFAKALTEDEIQIKAYELRRMSLRKNANTHLFRTLHDDDQACFRDYGALKHTTLAAQCAVCHRLHEVSDAHLGGFITLSPSAKPSPATTGLERLHLAEREVLQFLGKLRKSY